MSTFGSRNIPQGFGPELNRRHLLVLGAGAMTAALPGVASAVSPLKVVATTSMIADAARQIGGDLVKVTGLMGPGVDPHSYRQTRSDIVAMTRADLVLWHGLYLEAQMEDFLLGLGRKRDVQAVAEILPHDLLLAHDVYTDKVDPHIWMDPGLWAWAVSAVAEALSGALPGHRDLFAARLEAYRAELSRLGDYALRAFATVPAEARILVTAHDAFKYFGAAFGFEVVGIQGISTESEAGLNRIAEVTRLLVERRIAAAFVESSVSDRNIRALIEGAAAQGHDVRIGGELYSDAMGQPGTYEGTYIGMFDHNVTTIASALGGSVPPRGLNGALSLRS